MENEFSLSLDSFLLKPLDKYIKRHKIKVISNEPTNDYFKIALENATYKEIFLLGGCCYSFPVHWNKKMEDQVRERSETAPWGKKIFSGTEEEKEIINRSDLNARIDFEVDYFEKFLMRIREHHAAEPANYRNNDVTFDVTLNDEESIIGIENKCNTLFGTVFIIKKFYFVEGMCLAQIEAEQASMLDVFSLGYLVSYNDEQIKLERQDISYR